MRTSILAALLLLASPARATPADPVGHYYLQGVMETGSELLLQPDGKFQWYLSVGALDLFAEGKWREKGGKILLTSEQRDKAPPPGFETLELPVQDGNLIPPDGHGAYVRAKASAD